MLSFYRGLTSAVMESALQWYLYPGPALLSVHLIDHTCKVGSITFPKDLRVTSEIGQIEYLYQLGSTCEKAWESLQCYAHTGQELTWEELSLKAFHNPN